MKFQKKYTLLVVLTLNVNEKQKNKKLYTLVYKIFKKCTKVSKKCTKVYRVQKIKKSVQKLKKKILYTFVH